MEDKKNTNMENDIIAISKDIGYIKKALEENKEEHRQILKMLNQATEKNEERYAFKWVEAAMKGFIGIIVTTVIIALLSTIIIN
jgi:single-stranded DNA-specific DHH superfamily exonuclease